MTQVVEALSSNPQYYKKGLVIKLIGGELP
jgi:hypothetical protein